MLSRIAESLYWIGRYLERADDTARLLDVHLQLTVDDPLVDPVFAGQLLLSVMGVETDEPFDSTLVMRLLCQDPGSPSSIMSALTGARESARRSRETVSAEMWEAINMTWHGIQSGELSQGMPTATFRWVRERCAVITGIADGTMSHDQGWYFLLLGRSLERVDMTARLLIAAAFGSSVMSWASALRACGADHAFVRSYRDQDSERDAAEFLILDGLFPRSLVYTLGEAQEALSRLDWVDRRIVAEGDAARLLGRARAELEYRTRGEMLTDLPERMSELQATCNAANDAISRRFFEGAVAAQWHEGAGA